MKQIKLGTFLVLVVASFFLRILDSRGILEPVRSVAMLGVAPIQYSLFKTKQGVQDFLSFATFWKSGEARIRNLELRNLELVGYKAKFEALSKENEEFRKQLGVYENSGIYRNKKLLPALVLGRERYLEIGVGSSDGVVKEGSMVVVLDSLVGRVVRVSERTSFVQLPTDSSSKIPVRVGRTSGLVSGQFSSSIVLDRVAQNEEINTNDLVLTSGEGGSFSPGLIVGKIREVGSRKTDLFQTAQVVPLIDYGRLTTVFVVLD